MLKTKGVAHFTIPVTDTRRSTEFYSEILGLEVVNAMHERGMVFLDSGGDCIILAKTNNPISTKGEEDVHHAFIVDHDAYDSSVQFLKDKGVKVLYGEDMQGGVVNGPRTYFEDPDGNILEIIDLTSYRPAAE